MNDNKEYINRVNRLSGQMQGVGRMIEEHRDVKEIIIQLSAIDKSIKSLANNILNDEITNNLINEVNSGNTTYVNDIISLFKRFQ